jgi:hypothetical protein
MRKLLYLPILLCFLSTGCALTDDAIKTAEVAAAGNERYHVLAQKALDGDAVLEKDGVKPITKAEWGATPGSVKFLIDRLLNGLSVNRKAFYSIAFQLDGGVDPETLELKPVAMPGGESDGLIDGDNQ